MKQGNLGNATTVLGNTFNIIMSNATLPQMLEYKGNANIPANSLIVVNPLNSKGEDAGWYDLCVTDNNTQDMGVVSLLPFTSVGKGLKVEAGENGNRILTVDNTSSSSTMSVDIPKYDFTKGATSVSDVINMMANKIASLEKRIQELENVPT